MTLPSTKPTTNCELTAPSPLLQPDGKLTQVGWSRQPVMDCNLEQASFYSPAIKSFQRLRIKRWDYYAVFTPRHFFSATISDIGYMGMVFVYIFDYTKQEFKEETLMVRPWKVTLPRNSEEGLSVYQSKEMRVAFQVSPKKRLLSVDWPSFDKGKGIRAELALSHLPQHESMNIVIPFDEKRFYFNRKINCLPAEGIIQWGEIREEVFPSSSLGQLDWGRGMWPYRSFWNWASASGYMFRAPRAGQIKPEQVSIGLNLGQGFGDTSAATENAVIVNGRIHKLGNVKFTYDPKDYNRPWLFSDDEKRLDLMFTPFFERIASTNMGVLSSEVHQMFGRYTGRVILDTGEELWIDKLLGFAEEHHAKW